MSDLVFSEARSRAAAALAKVAVHHNPRELAIINDAVTKTDFAWYFPYDTLAFICHGDVSAALAGNLPIKVPRGGTATSFEAPPSDSD
jgi:hypothetical protein